MNLINLHDRNKVIVSMGYDNIETNITLSSGHGSMLPDPLIIGSYNLVWWNSSDYLEPINDPFVEVVKCIAKLGDTLIVIRSQQISASPKNIPGKLYKMTFFPLTDNNIDTLSYTLSYYNVPQPHGISVHTGTIATWANIDKTTSSIADITTKSHTLLTDIGTNTHATIDTSILNSTTHIGASVAHGVTGNIVGTTDNQTLSNKTLTAPNINILKPATDSTTAIQLTKADGSTPIVNVDTTNKIVSINTTSPWSGSILQVRATTDENLVIAGHNLLSDGVSIHSINDAITANKGLELRGTPISLNIGNVGIGTIDMSIFTAVGSTAKLVVVGSDSRTGADGSSSSCIAIVNTDDTTGNAAGLHFGWQDTDGTPNFASASIVTTFGARVAGQYPSGDLHFLTSTAINNSPSEKMTILASGNVGIGATNPTAKLHIGGTPGTDGIKFPDGTLQTTASTTTGFELTANKNVANGYAGLDANVLIAEAQDRKRAWLTGTDVYHSHDAEVFRNASPYAKLKTITLTHIPNAILRVYFEMKINTGGSGAFGQVYRNGVSVGTARNNASVSYVAYTENIAGWSEGDTLELWGYSSNAAGAYFRNFRILYNGNAVLTNS